MNNYFQNQNSFVVILKEKKLDIGTFLSINDIQFTIEPAVNFLLLWGISS